MPHEKVRILTNSATRLAKRQDRTAFTLVELLVVIAIIGLLITLLLPAVQAARESARRTQCANRLKQIGLAIHNFHSSQQELPPAYFTGGGYATWLMLIMPYLEEGNVHETINVGHIYYELPESVRHTQVSFYYCPSRRGPPQLSVTGDRRGPNYPNHLPGALADYAMCGGTEYPFWNSPPDCGGNGVARSTLEFSLSGDRCTGPAVPTGKWDSSGRYYGWKTPIRFMQITDGLSHTLLAGEKFVHADHFGEWEYGDNSFYNDEHWDNILRMIGPGFPILPNPDDPTVQSLFDDTALGSFGSWHAGGVCNFVFCDGSVRGLVPSTSTTLLGYVSQVADGNPIGQKL